MLSPSAGEATLAAADPLLPPSVRTSTGTKKRRHSFRPSLKSGTNNKAPSSSSSLKKAPPPVAKISGDAAADIIPGGAVAKATSSNIEQQQQTSDREFPSGIRDKCDLTVNEPSSNSTIGPEQNKKVGIMTEVTMARGPEAAQATTTPSLTVQKRAAETRSRPRPRKRKQTGVAVGASRTPGQGASIQEDAAEAFTTGNSFGNTGQAAAVEADVGALPTVTTTTAGLPSAFTATTAATIANDADAAILAQAPGEGSCLTTFCSRYESRRHLLGRNKKKSDKNQPAAAQDKDDAASEKKKEENDKVTEVPIAPAGPIVQIVNGEIVLQESSLVVNGSDNKPDDEFSVVEEEAQLAVVGASYNSFVKRRRPQHWTAEETERFYEALRQVGTDFGTMEAYFDSKRTRKQLKRKFQIESTKNPRLIEKSLDPTARKEIDLSIFELTEQDTQKLASAPSRKEAPLQDVPAPEARTGAAIQVLGSSTSAAIQPEEIEEDEVDEDAGLQQEDLLTTLEWPDLSEPVEETGIVGDPLLDREDTAVDTTFALVTGAAKKTKPKMKPRIRSMLRKKKK